MLKTFIKRKPLTPDQYQIANKTMMILLMVCYLVYIVVEYTSADYAFHSRYRIIVYIAIALLDFLVVKMKGDKKVSMLFMAVTFLLSYILLVMNNNVICMVLAFPAMIGFMLYLNSLLMSVGCFMIFVTCALKCAIVKSMGDIISFKNGNLITVGFVVCIYGSYMAIKILYKYNQQDRAVIEKEVAHRAEVADTVNRIVEDLDKEFTDLVEGLVVISEDMTSADISLDEIAGSTENTAEAVTSQSDMTGQIQELLEHTGDLAMNAQKTTEDLKCVVVDGKHLSDNLQEQSDLVDQNIGRISETVQLLVENVQKVSGITDSIFNISSQTNLLALNASIEAARAGEAGRGFSVVADEIRKLAEETKSSTEKITAIINELTTVTNKTQAEIEESVEAIKIQRNHVLKVNESFSQVENSMLGLQSDVTSMSQKVESVLESNKQIVDSIFLLSETSQEVSMSALNCKSRINSTTESLGKFSQVVDGTFLKLQRLVEVAHTE